MDERGEKIRDICGTIVVEHVGFRLTDQRPNPFKFDTTLGNNGGKGYKLRNATDCELSDLEREALLEFSKTL